MHQAQIHAESVLFVCPALSFVKSPLHFHHAALQGGHFVFWFRIPPGLNLSEIHARGRGGLQPGASRDSIPPWGRPKADWAARTSSRRSSKADRPARTSSRRSAKADNGGRLCPAQGFSGRAAGRNGALPYNARKSQFLRNGDVWATESLFLFAVLWLAFLPDQSETGVAGGGKAHRPETPAAPRRPAQRPRPAPGFCAASANARPGDPAPVRLLEKALWVLPTTEPFRPAPSGKPERKKERRNPG